MHIATNKPPHGTAEACLPEVAVGDQVVQRLAQLGQDLEHLLGSKSSKETLRRLGGYHADSASPQSGRTVSRLGIADSNKYMGRHVEQSPLPPAFTTHKLLRDKHNHTTHLGVQRRHHKLDEVDLAARPARLVAVAHGAAKEQRTRQQRQSWARDAGSSAKRCLSRRLVAVTHGAAGGGK